MPSFDHSEFADYLCCVVSFLGPLSHQLMARRMHKEFYEDILMTQLFKELQVATINDTLIAKIVNTTAQLENKLVQSRYRGMLNHMKNRFTEIVRFCSLYRADGWLDVVLSAATLARIDEIENWESMRTDTSQTGAQEVGWIYLALEHVQILWGKKKGNVGNPEEWDDHTVLVVEGLLQLLVSAVKIISSQKPTAQSLSVILQALSTTNSNISYFALQALHANQTWFTDPELGPIMQKVSTWSDLGRSALKSGSTSAERYLDIGNEIAVMAEWKPFVYKDLPSWVTAFSRHGWNLGIMSRDRFKTVICNVWVPNFDIQYKFRNEVDQSWALAVAALANVWGDYSFIGASAIDGFVQLARSTLSTFLQVDYYDSWSEKTQRFSSNIRVEMSAPLSKALYLAAANVRNATTLDGRSASGSSVVEIPEDNSRPSEQLAEWLETLGEKIGTEFEPCSGEVRLGGSTKQYKDWTALEKLFQAEIDSLEELLTAQLSH
ncbi:hypothetical protein C8R44DRAFT_916176 [Mycena epipterygia]|nr:hypothetical protein C8R44DRAFT_916176 [Mycena epipterygia]